MTYVWNDNIVYETNSEKLFETQLQRTFSKLKTRRGKIAENKAKLPEKLFRIALFQLHLFFNKQSIFDPRPENCLSFSKKLPQKIV